MVFEFAYRFVPILKNIRYPAFAFPQVAFWLIFLACITLQILLSHERVFSWHRKAILKFGTGASFVFVIGVLCVCETLLFVIRSGASVGQVHSEFLPSTPTQLDAIAFRSRETSVVRATNTRRITISDQYEFADKAWISKKELSNQGYSASDSPLYWYMKNSPRFDHVFELATQVVTQPALERANFTSDNDYLRARAERVTKLEPGVVNIESHDGTSKIQNLESSCTISNPIISPNELRATVDASGPCFLLAQDKYFPGWQVRVNGREAELIEANGVFKGVWLEKGHNEVKFQFDPPSWRIGLLISAATLAVILIITLIREARRILFRS
jgi:hypothetical protein